MRRYIQKEIEDPLAEAIISSRTTSIGSAALSVKDGKIVISFL
jgi:ATP-dependent Clp protease ATP-binding subunit ClpA